MVTSVVPALLVFLCCIWIIRCAGKGIKKNENDEYAQTTPLPPRIDVSGTANRLPPVRPNNGSYTPLPQRTERTSERAGMRGPRGIYPNQFPSCPIDRQRNMYGQPQKIFWYEHENCYRCSNGHRFGSNGSIIID